MKEIELPIPGTKPISIKSLLRKLINHSLKNEYGFAFWKSPDSNKLNIILDPATEQYLPEPPDLEKMKPGFLVSPFENDSNRNSYLIQADLHIVINLDSQEYELSNGLSPDAPGNSSLISQILNENIADYENPYSLEKEESYPVGNEKEKFLNTVRSGIQKIKDKTFDKVVPSRIESIKIGSEFDLSLRFLDLINAYPHAFVSLFHLKGHGIWIGASPEILIQVEENRYFTTTAVAGTQKVSESMPPSKVGWTQKEIVEQALVSRYIINCFKKIRLREFEESGPKTVKAGNLLHLRTDYRVDMQSVHYPQLGSVMLKLLHPTSAVSGMPKEPSFTFIKKNESFNRSFFSGFLGPVNMEGTTSLYVNIRCAQVFNDALLLYAGAGVTIDSEPEKEWEETGLKLKTIKDILIK